MTGRRGALLGRLWPTCTSLSCKVRLGFGLVLALHVTVAVMGHLGLDHAKANMERFDRGRRLSVQMVEIDRLVGELQRHVVTYTFTGNSSAEAEAEQIHARLVDEIARADRLADVDVDHDLAAMRRSLDRYHARFRLAVEDRRRRQQLMDIELVAQSRLVAAQLHLAADCSDPDSDWGRLLNRLDQVLLTAVNGAHDYLARLAPEGIAAAREQLAAVRGTLAAIDIASPHRRDAEDMMASMAPFERVLVALRQSTRGYLHLVNVVLAGEAAAFLRRSRELRETHLARLDALQHRIRDEQDGFQRWNAVISLITIVLGIAAGSMIGRLVVRPLRAMTATLTQLAMGDLRAAIPGRDRSDEIGAMAGAAEVFRERSEETVRLLDETRRLSAQRAQDIADLERSNRDLDSFAHIASHDLRAPLRAMNAAVEWIEEDCGDALPAAGRTHLQLLRSRVARMNRLLADLLEFSTAGRSDYDVAAFGVHDMLGEVTELLSPKAGFRVVVRGQDARIRAPRVPIERVVANLIDNAIKHHDRPHGVVTVTTAVGPDFLELAVADDGPGIAEEYHGTVFEPFRTLRPRDEVEGSGVGLALVRRLVERGHGTISIRSDPRLARGTTITARWPLAAGAVIAEAPDLAEVAPC